MAMAMAMADKDEVMRVLKQSQPAMEEKYHVRVSDDALKLVSFHATLGIISEDDAIPSRAVEIMDGACKLVLENFKNCAYESELFDKEYELRRAMAEHKELYRDSHLDSQYWVAKAQRERNYAAFYLHGFLNRWNLVLIESEGDVFLQGYMEKGRFFNFFKDYVSEFNYLDRRLAEEEGGISEYLINRSKEAVKLTSEFLEDLYQRIIRCFLSLLTVKPCHVAEVVGRLNDVPLTQTLGPFVSILKKNAIYKAKQRVVNQDDVIDKIFKTVAGPRHMTMRPRGAFLLLGGPGVGKREIAKAIAEHWYRDESRLVEIDMSQYAEPQSGSTSCNLPHWSDGQREHLWRRLTDVVKARSYSVILLDKIDKVLSSVITGVLLDVLGNDAPTDCEGNRVDFSNSIIFMTSSVGVDQLQLACNCLVGNDDLRMEFRRDPKAFRMIHSCVVNKSRHERVIAEARKFFSADMLASLDGLFVLDKFCNWKAVARLLLREIVSKHFGRKSVVHVSDAALGALVLKAASADSAGPGKAIRKTLHEHVVPHLFDAESRDNVVVCVDTLVGTRDLSFRCQAYEPFMDDWFLNQKDGLFGKMVVNLRRKMELVYNIMELRTKCLPLLHGTVRDFTQLEKYLSSICDAILMFSPFHHQPIRCPHTEDVSSYVGPDILPTDEEKERIKDLCRKWKENGSSRIKKICVIAGSTMKLVDDPWPFPDLPVRSYIFLGLYDDAKTKLIDELAELLSYGSGKSLFRYVKLEENNCDVHKKLLIETVKEKPGMVVMFDGVENANDVFHQSLLHICDYGTLDDEDLIVDFRRTIIILVSESASFVRIARLFNPGVIMHERQNVKRFRTELLHRVDEIVFFDPLLPQSDSRNDILRLPKRHPIYREGLSSTRVPEFLVGVFKQKNKNDSIPSVADKEFMDPVMKKSRGCDVERFMDECDVGQASESNL